MINILSNSSWNNKLAGHFSHLVSFFYYESCKGLLVKWKVQHEGLVLKILNTFLNAHLSSFFLSYRHKFIFNFVFNWFHRSIFTYFLQKKLNLIYKYIHSYIYLSKLMNKYSIFTITKILITIRVDKQTSHRLHNYYNTLQYKKKF